MNFKHMSFHIRLFIVDQLIRHMICFFPLVTKQMLQQLSKLITHFEVTCSPADLPEYFEVDISALAIGDSIHMSAITLPKNVVLTHAVVDHEHDQVVVSIHQPRAEEIEEAAPVAVETVITGQKTPEEQAAEDAKEAKEKAKAEKK